MADAESQIQSLKGVQSRIAHELRSRKPDGRTSPVPPPTSILVPEQGDEGMDLDLVSEADRQSIRATVANQPTTMKFLMEMAPSTIGAIAGTAITAPIPIPGARVFGASVGGLIGEALGQETGVSPKSNLNLDLAAAGGPLGHIAGETLKLGRKALGKAFTGLAPAKVALAKASMRKAVTEFESVATRILASQKGLMSQPADKLYKLARQSGIEFPANHMTSTAKAFEPLLKELMPLKQIPEARTAIRMIAEQHQLLTTGKVSFDDILSAREAIGYALKEVKTGTIKGARKQFFKAVSDDLDKLGKMGGKLGKTARVAQAAAARSKLELSVKELQTGIGEYISYEVGTKTLVMNVKNARNWLRKAITPGSKKYNKKMADSLAEFTPDIDEALMNLSKFTETSPAGPGSLVIRGIGAGAFGKMGMIMGGPPGAAVGAVVGTRMPEMILGIMSSRPAMAFLQKAAVMGRGEISGKIWAMAGQIATSGVRDQPAGQSQNSTGVSMPMPPPLP